ncbi:MAG: UDP-N-acetylmuramate dehydrogenase [Magnetococcales bacterium]|nr:UDP-N-acetylmuramate dehydrogenase [Magnetococcales bacterium]
MNPFAHVGLANPILTEQPLALQTTWRIGGAARWLLRPASLDELGRLLTCWPAGIPRLVLGGGSNVLVADQGFAGAVLDLTHGVNRIYTVTESLKEDGSVLIHADAGAATRALAHFARRAGLRGAEFLAGIPGSIGGAVRMNAGAYGGEMREILKEVELLNARGERLVRTPEQLGMGYRCCTGLGDQIVISVRVCLQPDDPEQIRQRMRTFNRQRRLSQPLEWPNAGSVFKNPPAGGKAWELIAQAGLRGMQRGDAQISPKHCNFFVNLGQATAAQMHDLITMTQQQVAQHSGVLLQPEVQLVGWNREAP